MTSTKRSVNESSSRQRRTTALKHDTHINTHTDSKNTVLNTHTHKMSHSVSSSCQGLQRHPECPRVTARLQRSAGGVLLSLWSWSSHMFQGKPGKATESDWRDTPNLGGQVRSRKVWLRVQRVSWADGRLDPAQDRDRSERRRLHSAHGTATCGRPVKSRSYKHMSRLARQECAHAQYVSIKCLWQSTEYSLQF